MRIAESRSQRGLPDDFRRTTLNDKGPNRRLHHGIARPPELAMFEQRDTRVPHLSLFGAGAVLGFKHASARVGL
jgi:hypothetical protein